MNKEKGFDPFWFKCREWNFYFNLKFEKNNVFSLWYLNVKYWRRKTHTLTRWSYCSRENNRPPSQFRFPLLPTPPMDLIMDRSWGVTGTLTFMTPNSILEVEARGWTQKKEALGNHRSLNSPLLWHNTFGYNTKNSTRGYCTPNDRWWRRRHI